MKDMPKLREDFILDESDYQTCKTWLAEADEETLRHLLGNPSLDAQRREVRTLIAEYEENWRHSTIPKPA